MSVRLEQVLFAVVIGFAVLALSPKAVYAQTGAGVCTVKFTDTKTPAGTYTSASQIRVMSNMTLVNTGGAANCGGLVSGGSTKTPSSYPTNGTQFSVTVTYRYCISSVANPCGPNNYFSTYTVTGGPYRIQQSSPPPPPNPPTPPPPAAPPTVNLQANNSDGPVSVVYGGMITLSWQTISASSCQASNAWSGAKNVGENLTETRGPLTSSGTYQLTCSGAGGSATDSVAVNVQPPTLPPPTQSPPTVDLKANNSDGPITVPSGSMVNLTWTTNAMSCQASNAWSGAKNGGILQSETRGPITISSTFKLTCTNSAGSAFDSVVVNVQSVSPPPPPATSPTVNLKANNSDGPITVPSGSTVNLTWSTTNASACQASDAWSGAKNVGTNITESRGPLTTSGTYKLTCTGIGGSVSDSVTVNADNQLSSISTVTGDVYAGGSVANLTIDPSSVVSASGSITNVGTSNTIASYTRATAAETATAINTLLAEKGVKLSVPAGGPYVLTGDFNLNPKTKGNPKDLTDNSANPEGGVWYIPGDLLMQSARFLGRGTIVVEGNVTIKPATSGGEITYAPNGMLGVIARGNNAKGTKGDITIDPNVKTLVGAYYAPTGTIQFGGTGSAVQTYSYASQFPTYGCPTCSLFYGWGNIKIDPSGNLLIAKGQSINKFTSSGSYITGWDLGATKYWPEGKGSISANMIVYGFALDSAGNMLLAAEHDYSVWKVSSAGDLLSKFRGGSVNFGDRSPTDVAIDSAGNFYVTDPGHSSDVPSHYRVLKFSPGGTLITKWGSYGLSDGQFGASSSPLSLAIDKSDNVYVVDARNNRIQKFTKDGTFITKWGSKGSGNGQFAFDYNNFGGIAVDDSNNVFVVDGAANRVQKFDSNGNYLTQFGTYGTGNGQFFSAMGIGVDHSGNIYVHDAGAPNTSTTRGRVQKFVPSATPPVVANPLTATGLFVGNKIEFNRAGASITYDGRITKQPPLGFSQRFTPTVNDLTP